MPELTEGVTAPGVDLSETTAAQVRRVHFHDRLAPDLYEAGPAVTETRHSFSKL